MNNVVNSPGVCHAAATSDTDLCGWTPIRLDWEEGQGWLDWGWLGGRRFREPFFDQAIEAMLKTTTPRVQRLRTPIDVLDRLASSAPHTPPRGFIFHMSRCGSTLLSQMLAALPRNLVISEARVIDSVVHAHLRVSASDAKRVVWLRGLVAAFARTAARDGHDLFVKFDSWHVLQLPLIQRVFPDVPWVFVYRHPLEVLASHARQRQTPIRFEDAERTARILTCFCRSALQHLNDNGRLVEYRDLPDGVWLKVLAHFGLAGAPTDIERMQTVAQFDAKNPSRRFRDDSQVRLTELPENTRVAVEDMLMPLYESLRRRQAIMAGTNVMAH